MEVKIMNKSFKTFCLLAISLFLLNVVFVSNSSASWTATKRTESDFNKYAPMVLIDEVNNKL